MTVYTWLSQSHIRCVAQPGYDPKAAIVIDLGWHVTVTEGLQYRPSFLCTYNTTYDEIVTDVRVETLLEKYRLPLWTGFVFGFGFWFALVTLLLKFYNKDPRDVFQPGPVDQRATQPTGPAFPSGL